MQQRARAVLTTRPAARAALAAAAAAAAAVREAGHLALLKLEPIVAAA